MDRSGRADRSWMCGHLRTHRSVVTYRARAVIECGVLGKDHIDACNETGLLFMQVSCKKEKEEKRKLFLGEKPIKPRELS